MTIGSGLLMNMEEPSSVLFEIEQCRISDTNLISEQGTSSVLYSTKCINCYKIGSTSSVLKKWIQGPFLLLECKNVEDTTDAKDTVTSISMKVIHCEMIHILRSSIMRFSCQFRVWNIETATR